MALAAVFLDLGNTLLCERPARAEIYAEAAHAHGLAVDAARMGELMASAHAELPRELAGAFRYSDAWFRAFQRRIFVEGLGLAPARFEVLSAELFARFEDARTFQLYPGARELLAELRARGLGLGLVSNWSARLGALLRALGLEQAFDFHLSSAVERREKPDPLLFRTALARAGVEPAAALHAGDDPRCDARGALGVGMAAVLVDHAGRLGAEERGLCPTVASLFELRDLVLERVA